MEVSANLEAGLENFASTRTMAQRPQPKHDASEAIAAV